MDENMKNTESINPTSVVTENEFIKEALYEKFKAEFAHEIEETLLNQGTIAIGDIGSLSSSIKNQGTRSGEVIKNVKLKFTASKQFRRKVNEVILGKSYGRKKVKNQN